MKSNKEYRFEDNPKEQVFHDKFKEMFEISSTTRNTLSSIIFGWKDASINYPNKYLTQKEEDICLNMIQWLGSPVGLSFLHSCGFVKKD